MRVGKDDEHLPLGRKIEMGEQGGNAVFGPAAAVDDQAAASEAVQPDPGPQPAAAERGQRGGGRFVMTGQSQQQPGHAQAELGAHAQPDVFGRGVPDHDPGGGNLDSRRHQPLGDPERAIGQGAFGLPARRRLDGQADAGSVDHQADPAELPGEMRTPAQQAEVEATGGPKLKLGHG